MQEIDLVLSGSGIRFYAFWGAYQELRKHFKIKRIAGTSGGSIVGGLISLVNNELLTYEEAEKILMQQQPKKYIDPNFFFWNGWCIYKGKKFLKILHDVFKDHKFSDLKDLYVVVTDLSNRKPVVLSAYTTPNEKVYKWIYASSAVPFVFRPLKVDNRMFVDGLVTINFAIDLFEDNKRPTIGLRVTSSQDKEANLKSLVGRTIAVVETFRQAAEREHVEDAYWARVIRIDTGSISSLDFFDADTFKPNLIERGRQTTCEWIQRNKEDLLE